MASENDRLSNLRSSPSKKKHKLTRVTTVEETPEDRISELPDSLLIQILSLLPTDDAFAACILSKSDMYEYGSEITRCLSFVAEKKVENVMFTSLDETIYALPESFCTCSSLISLEFSLCGFDYDSVIEWKSLKRIHLEFSVISDDDIVNLLSGCPALETMQLNGFQGSHRMEINSMKLKRLILEGYRLDIEESDHYLEILAPYLQHLEISGDLYDLKCRLVNVSSLVNAKLTFEITCIKDILVACGEEFDEEEDSCRDYHQAFRTLVQDYHEKLSYATELTIGTWFTEFKGVPFPELKCKYLTLELHLKRFNLYGVLGLLRASPHVEILNIDMTTTPLYESLCHFELRYLAEGDKIDLQSWISSFVFPNLKKVKIVISFEVCLKDQFVWKFDKLFKLSEFLVKTATVLEMFVIVSKRMKCKKCSMNCVSECLFKLA